MAAAVAAPSSWEELPQDLLGLVLQNLPSLADRVRVRAVCRSHIRCAPILREGVFGYLAVDNLAFLGHDDGACSLMNPLSGMTLHLPKLASAVGRALDESAFYDQSHTRKTYVKVILSASPLDSAVDPLRSERFQGSQRICDIAFFHGKLYALTTHEGLRVIELDDGHLSEAKSLPGFLQCIPDDPKQQEVYNCEYNHRYLVLRYIAESDGRLLMVRRWMSIPPDAYLGEHDRTVRFEAFQADLAIAPGRWLKVDSSGGHAIFLDTECSKSVLASQGAGGVQEDSIYFMHRVFDNTSKEFFTACMDPLADSGTGKITPSLPEVVMGELQSKWQFLTWFFPADT
ncbi:hypothetical protein GQ55_6G163800 [Panicum hallii var. hallii]|uniref:KIB1-4 beta-propeller domain-containing protein n=1 Tax=Panicum hallii var. hallii TaxID=1504633 RepID=A0A2T7D6N4_9POAL|nr:hypothetical protein GQ55_6G163800 [Panicum hallii var. hallii]